MAETAGQWHALINYFGQHRRPPTLAIARELQTTEAGKKFFEELPKTKKKQIKNMPRNFAVEIDSGIPTSGLHYYDKKAAPSVQNWVEPVLIMGAYGGALSFWEPMVPIEFVTGSVLRSKFPHWCPYNPGRRPYKFS